MAFSTEIVRVAATVGTGAMGMMFIVLTLGLIGTGAKGLAASNRLGWVLFVVLAAALAALNAIAFWGLTIYDTKVVDCYIKTYFLFLLVTIVLCSLHYAGIITSKRKEVRDWYLSLSIIAWFPIITWLLIVYWIREYRKEYPPQPSAA